MPRGSMVTHAGKFQREPCFPSKKAPYGASDRCCLIVFDQINCRAIQFLNQCLQEGLRLQEIIHGIEGLVRVDVTCADTNGC